MKRLLVGLSVLGVILLLSILGIFYTDNLVENIIDTLDNAAVCLYGGDFSGSKEGCEKAIALFDEKQKVLSLFLNHGLLEEIEEALSLLPNMATSDTEGVFLSLLEKTQTNLNELKLSQKQIF